MDVILEYYVQWNAICVESEHEHKWVDSKNMKPGPDQCPVTDDFLNSSEEADVAEVASDLEIHAKRKLHEPDCCIRKNISQSQNMQALAASFICSVTVKSADDQEMIARNGDYSPISALQRLFPEVVTRLYSHMRFYPSIIFSLFR